jgi:hypothetical protein
VIPEAKALLLSKEMYWSQGPHSLKGDSQGPQGLKGDTGVKVLKVSATPAKVPASLRGDTGSRKVPRFKRRYCAKVQGLKGDTGSQGPSRLKGDTEAKVPRFKREIREVKVPKVCRRHGKSRSSRFKLYLSAYFEYRMAHSIYGSINDFSSFGLNHISREIKTVL